jgi:hypothetical protein
MTRDEADRSLLAARMLFTLYDAIDTPTTDERTEVA